MYTVVPLLATLVMAIIFGVIARNIAEPKGVEHGFAWGFWLGVIGIIVVATKQGYQPTYTSSYSESSYFDKKEPAHYNEWRCECGSWNSNNLSICPMCRRHKDRIDNKKECPHCGAKNSPENVLCFACNKPMDGSEALPAPQVAAPSVESATPSVYTPAPALMSAAPQPVSTQPADTFDGVQEKLSQLKKWYDDGLIDEESYKAKCREILSRF